MEVDDTNKRTIEDVNRIFGFARLDNAELSSCVQCLNFTSELDNDAICLVEMDNSVIKQLQEGQRIVVRGNKGDPAVLCTDDKTFELREAETSNNLLLLPECDIGADESQKEFHLKHRQVCAMKQQYFELRSIKPRLKKLRHLLEENMYSGPECEADEYHQGQKFTFSDLLEEVQASENEIINGLCELQACKIGDFWRILEFDFIDKVLCHILMLREENNWSLDAVPAKECCDELGDIFPRSVVAHVLRCMSDLPNGEQLHHRDLDSAVEQSYKLGEDKICRHYAEILLRPVDKFNLKDFMESWRNSVPVGMTTSLYQLEGLALVERDTKPESIQHYSVRDLPEDIADRFNKLFMTKQKWTLDEITPYVKDLCTEKVGVSSYLTKYARASTKNGIKVYSSRKPVS